MTSDPHLSPSREEHDYFNGCLRAGMPYFGDFLGATQGVPERHCYLSQIIRDYCQRKLEKGPVRVLEVGSWAGGSAITIANVLMAYGPKDSRLYCIDHWRPYFDLAEDAPPSLYTAMNEAAKMDAIFPLFLHNIRTSGVDDIITVLRGPSDDTLRALAPEQFDIVFVDGDHSYVGVRRDLELVSQLLRPGGVMTGDDLELQYAEIDVEFTWENSEVDCINDRKTGAFYHPGVTLAVHEVFGKVGSQIGFWAAVKNLNGGWTPYEMPDLGDEPEPPAHLRLSPK